MIKKLEDVIQGDIARKPNNEEVVGKINEIVEVLNNQRTSSDK